MQKIVCLNCGHSRSVQDCTKMAPIDFVCPMCKAYNADYRIYDAFGKIIVDTKARKQLEKEARDAFARASKELEHEQKDAFQNTKETRNMAETWKYKVIFIEHKLCTTADQDAMNVERILNQHGAAGWELVHIENRSFYFKKRA